MVRVHLVRFASSQLLMKKPFFQIVLLAYLHSFKYSKYIKKKKRSSPEVNQKQEIKASFANNKIYRILNPWETWKGWKKGRWTSSSLLYRIV